MPGRSQLAHCGNHRRGGMVFRMLARFLIVFLSSLVIFAAPVAAADSAQVPEGSSVTLFALGLAGVMLGRRLSRRKSDKS